MFPFVPIIPRSCRFGITAGVYFPFRHRLGIPHREGSFDLSKINECVALLVYLVFSGPHPCLQQHVVYRSMQGLALGSMSILLW